MVFVADSQIERMEANIESLENLRTTWPSRATTSTRSRTSSSTTSATCRTPRRWRSCAAVLNPTKVPEFEACATNGDGVFDTLKAVAKLVLTELKRGASLTCTSLSRCGRGSGRAR